MKIRNPPRTASILNRWVDDHARQIGQPPARVRNWVSFMILGGALENAGFEGIGPKFTIKGGVALELRLRQISRATKDFDLILNSDTGDLIEELESALVRPYQGFSFRRKDEPERMPNGAVRVKISLTYLGKPWGTVSVDVARRGRDGAEVEMVEAISLLPLGLEGPEALPCLSLPYHVAQKIHAMTLPPPEGRRNERFRDLIDLLLIREWVTDFESVKRACREVFESRNTHSWPPFLTVPDHWVVPFERMASDLSLATTDVYHAAIEIRQFISTIDESAEWLGDLPSLKGLSATTWYFAVGPDENVHRIPAHLGEGFFTGERDGDVPIRPEWQRDPGGVALIGVVLLLRNRRPAFVEGVATAAIALTDEMAGLTVEYPPVVWEALAKELLRQMRVPIRGIRALSVFLQKAQCRLPCQVGKAMGSSTAQAHWWRTNWRWEWFLWDLEKCLPVIGAKPG